jgi:hypothetical protein
MRVWAEPAENDRIVSSCEARERIEARDDRVHADFAHRLPVSDRARCLLALRYSGRSIVSP